MAVVFAKLFFMLLSATAVSCYCSSSTLSASTYTKYKSVTLSNYDNCIITIGPSSSVSYSSNYYLQISWTTFDVKGDMPYCYNDYMEVFLTRSYKSIGRYCSNNLKTKNLFNMYSSDGYAKIKLVADHTNTGYGISFSYVLKNKKTQYLGSGSSYCSSSSTYSYSGNIYSSGWPNGYATSYSTCNQKIYAVTNAKTRVAFMDVDTNSYSYCSYYSSDNVQLTGSSYSSYTTSSVSGKMCSTGSIKAYDSSYKYLTIEHKRTRGSASSYRGFVAGYIKYESATSTTKNRPALSETSTNLAGLITGLIVGVIVLLLIILIPIWVCKKRSHGVVVRSNQPVSTNTTMLMTSTVQNTGTTTMPQTVNAPQYQYANPNAYQQFQGPSPYPAATYPTAYPTQNMAAQAYPPQVYPDQSFKAQEGNLPHTTTNMPNETPAHQPSMPPFVPGSQDQGAYPAGAAPQPAVAFPAPGDGQATYPAGGFPNQPPPPYS